MHVTGKFHAAAGPYGPAYISDEERCEEKGHSFPLGSTGAGGLHPPGQRQVGLHLWEPPTLPVQSKFTHYL